MNWTDAVLSALRRYSTRHQTSVIRRRDLILEEIDQIQIDTGTRGNTPEQSLSLYLQELRDAGKLRFSNRGEYQFIDYFIKAEDEDHSDEVLDASIKQGNFLIEDIPTSDELIIARRRRGQNRLRKCVLDNYQRQCALCDVTDEKLLVTSHIVRWADAPEIRGNLSNVICLCRFHDSLFEIGYISLTDDLQVIKKNAGDSKTIELSLITAERFRSPVSYTPRPEFLRKHRQRSGFEVTEDISDQ